MKRREFLELLGIPALLRQRGQAATPPARWRFAIDARGRWSLERGGIAAVREAEISIEISGVPPFALADLQGVRRFRTGSRRSGEGTLTLVGRLNGLEVTAQFDDDERPKITVRVRGLESAADLIAVHFTGGVSVAQSRAWINGYQSWSTCRMVDLVAGAEATGHWQLALLGGQGSGVGGQGLAFAFGETDGSSGEFRFTGRALDAVGRFGHRAVSLDHSPAVASLTILPSSDPFGALASDAAARIGPLRTDSSPSGWCSWYELGAAVTQADVLANLEAAGRHFDPRAMRIIQLDDGFQRAAGDWETNDKFPQGHRWLTDRIHAAGFQAGLWLAPFAVTATSGIPTVHPEWLLLNDDRTPMVLGVQPHWGGAAYGLDASQRVVQDWLRQLARHVVNAWGYDYLKLDFLHYGAQGTRPGRGASGHEALRAGLRALREGAGNAFVLGCGAPLQHALGLVDGMRIGADVAPTWAGLQPAAAAAFQRAHWHGRAWRNDPDAMLVREPLSLNEARAWATAVALSGQSAMASDRLAQLPAERLDILRRALPAADVRARAIDLTTPEAVRAPAIVRGDATFTALPRVWRFAPGDDLGRADPAYDDSAWQSMEIGATWEQRGHPGLDGFAWYRVRFTAPRAPPAGSLALALGQIDDADETYLNGVRIGATGAMPPEPRTEWQAYRRYPLERTMVRWGEENVLAVRVFDGGGGGGMWRLLRDAPPTRVLSRVRDDWWMLALFNWDDEARRITADLGAAGVSGALSVYDVWAERRTADVIGRVSLDVGPRSAAVIGLRRPRRVPYIIGGSRHIVQGSVDVEDERWDAGRRVLSGKAIRMDGRLHTITIALPPGFRPRFCSAAVTCAGTVDGTRAMKLELAGTRDDVAWEVSF